MQVIPVNAPIADMSNSEVRKIVTMNHAIWLEYVVDHGKPAQAGIDYVGADVAYAIKLPAFMVAFDIVGTGKFSTIFSNATTDVIVCNNMNEFYLYLKRWF